MTASPATRTPKSEHTQSVQPCIKKHRRAVEYYDKVVIAPKFKEPKQSEEVPAVQTRSTTKAPTAYKLQVEGDDILPLLPCVQRDLERNIALQTLLDKLFMVRDQLLEEGLLFECFLSMDDYNVIFPNGSEHIFGVKALSRLFEKLVVGLGDDAEHIVFWPPQRHCGRCSVSRKLVDVLARVDLRVKTN